MTIPTTVAVTSEPTALDIEKKSQAFRLVTYLVAAAANEVELVTGNLHVLKNESAWVYRPKHKSQFERLESGEPKSFFEYPPTWELTTRLPDRTYLHIGVNMSIAQGDLSQSSSVGAQVQLAIEPDFSEARIPNTVAFESVQATVQITGNDARVTEVVVGVQNGGIEGDFCYRPEAQGIQNVFFQRRLQDTTLAESNVHLGSGVLAGLKKIANSPVDNASAKLFTLVAAAIAHNDTRLSERDTSESKITVKNEVTVAAERISRVIEESIIAHVIAAREEAIQKLMRYHYFAGVTPTRQTAKTELELVEFFQGQPAMRAGAELKVDHSKPLDEWIKEVKNSITVNAEAYEKLSRAIAKTLQAFNVLTLATQVKTWLVQNIESARHYPYLSRRSAVVARIEANGCSLMFGGNHMPVGEDSYTVAFGCEVLKAASQPIDYLLWMKDKDDAQTVVEAVILRHIDNKRKITIECRIIISEGRRHVQYFVCLNEGMHKNEYVPINPEVDGDLIDEVAYKAFKKNVYSMLILPTEVQIQADVEIRERQQQSRVTVENEVERIQEEARKERMAFWLKGKATYEVSSARLSRILEVVNSEIVAIGTKRRERLMADIAESVEVKLVQPQLQKVASQIVSEMMKEKSTS